MRILLRLFRPTSTMPALGRLTPPEILAFKITQTNKKNCNDCEKVSDVADTYLVPFVLY